MKKIIKMMLLFVAIFVSTGVFADNIIGKVDNESLVKKYLINEKNKINSIAYAKSSDDNYGLKVTNALRPIKTPTYDGSNQAVHPKVLYFKNKWNGYKYWMGITPYPFGNDDYENPQILVSNDGVNFKSPKAHNKPLFVPSDVAKGGHYSDIHLCDVNGVLEVYFRYNPAKTEKNQPDNYKNYIYVTKSKDGIHWTDKELILNPKTFKIPCAYLSPIVNYDNGKYSIWFTNYDGNLYYTESYDLKSFKELKKCNFKGVPQKIKIWHQDLIKTDLGYEFVCCGYGDVFLNQNLYYSLSKDGINFQPLMKIMEPTHKIGTFDEKTLYRPSLVKRDGEYLLYYSAMDSKVKWYVGLSKDCKGIKTYDPEYDKYINPEIRTENKRKIDKEFKNNKSNINNKEINRSNHMKNINNKEELVNKKDTNSNLKKENHINNNKTINNNKSKNEVKNDIINKKNSNTNNNKNENKENEVNNNSNNNLNGSENAISNDIKEK